MSENNTGWKSWYIPLSEVKMTVREAQQTLKSVGAGQQEIPLIIKLIENPKYKIPGFEIFHGAVDLETHDVIHILLGRGLLPKDEAFVIGFTMGSTSRMSAVEEHLFTFFAKNVYPKYYRFDEDDIAVFKNGVRLGFVSNCTPLDQIKVGRLWDLSLAEARKLVGLEVDLLEAYYRIENDRFPDCPECERLLGE